jgi:hypothetical protein
VLVALRALNPLGYGDFMRVLKTLEMERERAAGRPRRAPGTADLPEYFTQVRGTEAVDGELC